MQQGMTYLCHKFCGVINFYLCNIGQCVDFCTAVYESKMVLLQFELRAVLHDLRQGVGGYRVLKGRGCLMMGRW